MAFGPINPPAVWCESSLSAFRRQTKEPTFEDVRGRARTKTGERKGDAGRLRGSCFLGREIRSEAFY